ncbi:hypothetical protein BGW80DRAFT_818928 [Lactifluus volemus]|nr:hypothetical protein BGW80DRAFT_818928 [Lactifluus volemus]
MIVDPDHCLSPVRLSPSLGLTSWVEGNSWVRSLTVTQLLAVSPALGQDCSAISTNWHTAFKSVY